MKIQSIISSLNFTGKVNNPVNKVQQKCASTVSKAVNYIFSKRVAIEPLLPKYYYNKVSMHIDLLESFKSGEGTKAVKRAVKESLADPSTEGRVTLVAASLDNKTYPMGFYYKLGFRSIYDVQNELCEEWLKNGGDKVNAPWIDYAYMYLPKENISQCLSYPEKLDILC